MFDDNIKYIKAAIWLIVVSSTFVITIIGIRQQKSGRKMIVRKRKDKE